MSTGSDDFYHFRIHKNEMIFLSTIHNPVNEKCASPAGSASEFSDQDHVPVSAKEMNFA